MSSTADISQAARRLREGGVVAFPTETVYGLGADALSPRAVAQVFALKGRPANNPLIVHVTGPEMAGLMCEFDERAGRLAREFWPGPLSLVLPRRSNVPSAVTGGGNRVAVRCPDHPVALALLFEFDSPLVGPSANRSGQVSPTRAEHVRGVWSEDEVMVLDGGPCREGIESTVLLLEEQGGRVLRPGVIGSMEISRVLGQPVTAHDAGGGGEVARGAAPMISPGLLARHYAPRTPARLLSPKELREVLADERVAGSAAVIVCADSEDVDAGMVIHMPATAEGYAAAMYDALRRADDAGKKLILIEAPGAGECAEEASHIWEAVQDRLRRATTPE